MKVHFVLVVAALHLCAFFHHCDAFLHGHTLATSPMPSKLNLRSSSDDNSQYNAYLHNTKRTCFHHFLTQRSIQSFMFLLTQVRDPHTSDWIERFLESTNLLEYHGTGAFNQTRFPEWDTFFWELLEEPKTSVIVEARRRAPIFGGSRNNPYLKKEVREKARNNLYYCWDVAHIVPVDLLKDQFVEYEIKIDPLSLVPRILSVREQIAQEITLDLKIASAYNDKSKLRSWLNKTSFSVISHSFYVAKFFLLTMSICKRR